MSMPTSHRRRRGRRVETRGGKVLEKKGKGTYRDDQDAFSTSKRSLDGVAEAGAAQHSHRSATTLKPLSWNKQHRSPVTTARYWAQTLVFLFFSGRATDTSHLPRNTVTGQTPPHVAPAHNNTRDVIKSVNQWTCLPKCSTHKFGLSNWNTFKIIPNQYQRLHPSVFLILWLI